MGECYDNGLQLLIKAATPLKRNLSTSVHAIIEYKNDFYLVQLLMGSAVYLTLVGSHFEKDKDDNGNYFYCDSLPKHAILCKGRLVNGLVSRKMFTEFFKNTRVKTNTFEAWRKIRHLLTCHQQRYFAQLIKPSLE